MYVQLMLHTLMQNDSTKEEREKVNSIQAHIRKRTAGNHEQGNKTSIGSENGNKFVFGEGSRMVNIQVNVNQQGEGTKGTGDFAPQESDDDFEYVNLVFFDEKLFGTYERQLALHNLLKEAFKRMSLDTGRDLVAIFIAYHFVKEQLLNMKCYTDFLQDTDSLMPGMLTKIKEDETSRTQRYKTYAESLATECEKWFIDNGCLPDKKEWKAKRYNYAVDTERRNRIQDLVTKLYQGMKEITR